MFIMIVIGRQESELTLLNALWRFTALYQAQYAQAVASQNLEENSFLRFGPPAVLHRIVLETNWSGSSLALHLGMLDFNDSAMLL